MRRAYLPESSQRRYEVMPANYVLRAIPLSAGHHRIRLEYLPAGFVVGKWISLVSCAAYLGGLGWYLLRRRRTAEGRREA